MKSSSKSGQKEEGGCGCPLSGREENMQDYIEIRYSYGYGSAGVIRINLNEFLPCSVSKLKKVKDIYKHAIWTQPGEMAAVHDMLAVLEAKQRFYYMNNSLSKEAQCLRLRDWLHKWEGAK